MGWSVNDLAPAARKQALDQLAPPRAEAVAVSVFDAAVSAGREIEELHTPLIVWLRARGILYLHANPRAKATIQKGHPDFEIYLPGAQMLFVEFKARAGKPSAEQVERIAELTDLGFRVLVARSLHEVTGEIEAMLSGEGEQP